MFHWFANLGPYVLAHIVRFSMLAFLFSLPAIGFPAKESQRIIRPGWFTDILYYFLTPL